MRDNNIFSSAFKRSSNVISSTKSCTRGNCGADVVATFRARGRGVGVVTAARVGVGATVAAIAGAGLGSKLKKSSIRDAALAVEPMRTGSGVGYRADLKPSHALATSSRIPLNWVTVEVSAAARCRAPGVSWVVSVAAEAGEPQARTNRAAKIIAEISSPRPPFCCTEFATNFVMK